MWRFCPELAKMNQGAAFNEPYAQVIKNVSIVMTITMLFRSAPFAIILIAALPVILVMVIYIAVVKKSVSAVKGRAIAVARKISRLRILQTVARRAEIESHCV